MELPQVWPAPAKLNLMLRVVGRRDDGYHLLQTVFQFIDLQDELAFSLRDDGRIRRIDGPADVPADADLAVRAAHALKAATGSGAGVDIAIAKRIPMGGGLGGGSSDAATTLVALNRLWQCGLDTRQLQQIGVGLGADVPIFVHGQAAWAEGVGEEFVAIEPAEPWYALFVPPVHVNTGKVFQDPDLTRNSDRITIRDFLAGDTVNDCLAIVRRRYPEVAQVFDWLNERAEARMTGTGACLFAACRDRAHADELVAASPAGVSAHAVRGCNRSALLDLSA
ncbi:MAG: 4-(cytidine 5'-diphospho)-2-C-methyl-D-erythritol kinase [Gammaproteobacteria bacterium]|nr:4-(cytidine 5'-diphospho)-2-C-methyl-D-erythritol kinase [Gammaproteobacteria bacterium]